jgi:hypothetical protein
VARAEGVRAFFVAYPTTLIMNVPYHGVMVAANESLRKLLRADETAASVRPPPPWSPSSLKRRRPDHHHGHCV